MNKGETVAHAKVTAALKDALEDASLTDAKEAYAAGYRAGQERMRVMGRRAICEFVKGYLERSIPANTVLGILSAQPIEDPPQEKRDG